MGRVCTTAPDAARLGGSLNEEQADPDRRRVAVSRCVLHHHVVVVEGYCLFDGGCMSRCTFKQGKFNCGSYAFNLYKNDIDQGDLCDVHYWQDQAQKARADEREACAKLVEDAKGNGKIISCISAAAAIRARGDNT